MTFKPYCPYCGAVSKQTTGREVYRNPAFRDHVVYVCDPCDAWVGCHPGTDKPLGRLANETLRRAKRRAHEAFDALWKPGSKQRTQSRDKAYYWLSIRMKLKPADCHIGMFDVEQCNQVVAISEAAHGPTTVSLQS